MKVVRWDASAWAFSPDKLRKVGLFQTERFFLDLYCLEPGQTQKAHAHAGADKLYLVAQGSARVQIGDEERTLHAGEGVLAASGEVHGLVNDSGERAVVLTFMSPPPQKNA
jgi:quercetin dioxygenase-like cupin family protein